MLPSMEAPARRYFHLRGDGVRIEGRLPLLRLASDGRVLNNKSEKILSRDFRFSGILLETGRSDSV